MVGTASIFKNTHSLPYYKTYFRRDHLCHILILPPLYPATLFFEHGIWYVVRTCAEFAGTSERPGVRSRLTKVHNYMRSWVYNRSSSRPSTPHSIFLIPLNRTKIGHIGHFHTLPDHIALNIIGELAYALVQRTSGAVGRDHEREEGEVVWSATLSAHYLIIILINQNNKSYI